MSDPAEAAPETPYFERCHCTGATRAAVIDAIRARGCRSVDQIRRATGACAGCQTCRPEVEALLAAQVKVAAQLKALAAPTSPPIER